MYSKTSLSGTPMGPARSVPLSEVSHLVKLANITRYWDHSSQFSLKFYFQIINIKMSNELLWGRYRFLIIWYYWRLLEVFGGKIYYLICYVWYLELWGVSQEFLFLSNTFWFCQPSPMLYSKLFLSLLLLFHILSLILFHYQAQWYYYPQLLWTNPPDFPRYIINASLERF